MTLRVSRLLTGQNNVAKLSNPLERLWSNRP
jgi:hypothetical protein